MKTWWRRVGTAELPLRQSLMNEYASQNGCPKRFFFRMEDELAGIVEGGPTAPWKRTMGTAVHETIARALRAAPEAICGGKLPSRERVLRVLGEELLRAAEDRPIDWKETSPAKEMERAADMTLGGMRTLGERAGRIVAVEAPFQVQVAGYHCEGTIDLLYAPKDDPKVLALADWKTGQRKLEPVVRDHGIQLGIYGLAVRDGILWPGEERATHIGIAPREMWIVQLYDLVPYEKPRRKADIGKPRGPAWYRSRRSADDDSRLRVSLKTIVGSIRLGQRPESLGEQCGRCPYRAQCLGEGTGPDAKELRDVERALDGIDDLEDLIPKVA